MKYIDSAELKKYELKPSQLRWTCSPDSFDFETTKEIKPLEEIVGQERAVKAIKRGLEIENQGWNIYAAGLAGTGRTSIIKKILEELEKGEVPNDLIYIYNFDKVDRPVSLSFPAGKGKEFKYDIKNLIEEIKDYVTSIADTSAFESDLIKDKQRTELRELYTKYGIPLDGKRDGNKIDPKKNKEFRKELKKLNLKYAQSVGNLSDENSEEVEKFLYQKRETLTKKYLSNNNKKEIKILNKNDIKLEQYLEAMFEDMRKHINLFDKKVDNAGQMQILGMNISQKQVTEELFKAYEVNLLVDNSQLTKKPIITEINPTYSNLVGKIEKEAVQGGGFKTNFTMIKSGSILEASGGYLVLDAFEVLTKPYSWDVLKRILKIGQVKIADAEDEVGLGLKAKSLEPDPIKVDTKIVMIGDPWVYSLLEYYDEDFKDLFKIKAEFQWRTDKTKQHLKDLASFTSLIVKENDLLPFDKTALGFLAEYNVRQAEYNEEMSLKFGLLKDLIVESNVVAINNKQNLVTRKEVKQALEDRINRENLLEERYQKFISKGYMYIDTEGSKVGEINSLSVLEISDTYEFGIPGKVTASVAQGDGEIINIDREAGLTGSFLDKGVYILSGYLREKFGQDKELSLTASLSFEQEYNDIDGDSASSTELYALLSSLSEVPIKQGIAVTGSVNQKGMVQPIGGVNAKVEGFFDVCKKKGLTGEQGVMIPEPNVKALMLSDRVVDAVKKKKFHIYTAKTIEEGIGVLTGVKADEVYKLADKKLMKYHLIEKDKYKRKRKKKKRKKSK